MAAIIYTAIRNFRIVTITMPAVSFKICLLFFAAVAMLNLCASQIPFSSLRKKSEDKKLANIVIPNVAGAKRAPAQWITVSYYHQGNPYYYYDTADTTCAGTADEVFYFKTGVCYANINDSTSVIPSLYQSGNQTVVVVTTFGASTDCTGASVTAPSFLVGCNVENFGSERVSVSPALPMPKSSGAAIA